MVYDTEILVSPQATSIWIDSAATIMELSADIGLGWMGLWHNLPTSYACISIILEKVIQDVQNIFLVFYHSFFRKLLFFIVTAAIIQINIFCFPHSRHLQLICFQSLQLIIIDSNLFVGAEFSAMNLIF